MDQDKEQTLPYYEDFLGKDFNFCSSEIKRTISQNCCR